MTGRVTFTVSRSARYIGKSRRRMQLRPLASGR
jgi:hypothetical protein